MDFKRFGGIFASVFLAASLSLPALAKDGVRPVKTEEDKQLEAYRKKQQYYTDLALQAYLIALDEERGGPVKAGYHVADRAVTDLVSETIKKKTPLRCLNYMKIGRGVWSVKAGKLVDWSISSVKTAYAYRAMLQKKFGSKWLYYYMKDSFVPVMAKKVALGCLTAGLWQATGLDLLEEWSMNRWWTFMLAEIFLAEVQGGVEMAYEKVVPNLLKRKF